MASIDSFIKGDNLAQAVKCMGDILGINFYWVNKTKAQSKVVSPPPNPESGALFMPLSTSKLIIYDTNSNSCLEII